MKKFQIHHAIGENRFTETVLQVRTYAGYVEAETLEQAYQKAQNTEDYWNKTNPCRSTSIGDLIQDGDKSYLVCNIGFKDMEELLAYEPVKVTPWCKLPEGIQEQFPMPADCPNCKDCQKPEEVSDYDAGYSEGYAAGYAKREAELEDDKSDIINGF